jgi:hypothetical protein
MIVRVEVIEDDPSGDPQKGQKRLDAAASAEQEAQRGI